MHTNMKNNVETIRYPTTQMNATNDLIHLHTNDKT